MRRLGTYHKLLLVVGVDVEAPLPPEGISIVDVTRRETTENTPNGSYREGERWIRERFLEPRGIDLEVVSVKGREAWEEGFEDAPEGPYVVGRSVVERTCRPLLGQLFDGWDRPLGRDGTRLGLQDIRDAQAAVVAELEAIGVTAEPRLYVSTWTET